MLRLIFQVDNTSKDIPAIKESLAMFLEQWGDVRLVSIREVQPQQVSMTGFDENAKSQTFGILGR